VDFHIGMLMRDCLPTLKVLERERIQFFLADQGDRNSFMPIFWQEQGRSHTRLLFWRQFVSTGLCLSASRAAGRILTSTFIRVAKRGRRRSTKPAIPKGGRQCANMLPHWDYLAQRSHRADRGRRRGVFAATYLAARRPVASLAECLGYLYEVITSKYHFLTLDTIFYIRVRVSRRMA